MSFFAELTPFPPDPIFGLNAEFKEDKRPHKKSFITGYFIQENGKVPLLKSVWEAEKMETAKGSSREYAPIEGDLALVEELGKCAFGHLWNKSYVCGIQTLGGTGALSLGGVLARTLGEHMALFEPTWVNHIGIFSYIGLTLRLACYYREGKIQIEEMRRHLEKMPPKSSVLLQTSCHNPTAMDLSKQDWDSLAAICKEKKLFPLFDMAYQGFAEEIEQEAEVLHPFIDRAIPFALAYTVSKNFSLYGERVGALLVFNPDKSNMGSIESHLKRAARATYSNPPVHGARLIKAILTSQELKQMWREEVSFMRQRINEVRMQFVALLGRKDPKGAWEFLNRGRGLFCYSGLSSSSVEYLRREKGFYIAQDGRINLTGLSREIIEPFVDAFLESRK